MVIRLIACFVLSAGAARAQSVSLTPLSSGAMPKMGGYRPQRLTLSEEKPATITKLPDGLSAPLFGVLPIGPAGAGENGATQVFHVIVDEPEGKPAVLYVDANGNGDMTDDPAADWKPKTSKGDDDKDLTQYNGGATLQIKFADATFAAHLGMYRFDKNDPQRAALRSVVLYYSDYGYEGEVALGTKTYKAMLTDDLAVGDFRGKEAGEGGSGVRLMLDVNGNGKFDSRGESFDIRQPFNVGGTTYEIADMSASGATFKVVKSAKKVDAIPTPPDHAVGKQILPFEATTTDGKAVKFPGDYRGKVVMIDFWATWCNPCMGEVPNLVKVYEEFHTKGFDVLGISLDQADSLAKVKEVTGEHKMTWPQVYDGKFWKAEIADKYAIDSIPQAYLVDGDTGEILADSRTLRGETLRGTIEKALEKKKANLGG